MSMTTASVRRDQAGVAHVVPVSGGKDSTALALALSIIEPRPYTYIHTPTGDELPEMAAHLRTLEGTLGAPILHLKNGTLASQIEANNMLPNVFARWCTRLLKLRPAGRFYEAHAPVICYVGLRSGEEGREGTRPGGDSASVGCAVRQDFPFQRWGWGLTEVWNFLSVCGVAIPERTDCARCPYQRLGEWYNLWERHPEIYRDAEKDEEKYGHTFRSPGRDSWPADLKSLGERFAAGQKPERSLRMMEARKGMCRACSL